jgi:transmembrane sensor
MSVRQSNSLKACCDVERRTDYLSEAVIDEAITWAIRIEFNKSEPCTRKAFDAWLHESPMHARAWSRLRGLQDDFNVGLKADFKAVPSKLALDILINACA